jgi:pimeloyl-ACP methyl ester carboxylesterase
MQSALIQYKNSVIYAGRFGKGNKISICFHGYGETCGSFRFFENQTENEFTFLAIDLPFHGQTQWNEGLNFTINDLVAIIKSAIEKLTNHKQDEDQKITLMGYSLGGRVALSLYQYDPGRIKKVILLAPDGLKVNFWYWLSTQTIIGNWLFSLTMKYPAWFFIMLKALNKLRLVNPSIFKSVNYYIGEAQVRKDLYQRWTCLRKLKPDLRLIKSQIRNFRTPFRIIYGKHDRIIIPDPGINFSKGIEEFCQIAEIHSGHQVLHEKHIKEILPVLLQ